MRLLPILVLFFVAASTTAQDFVARSISVPGTQRRGTSYTFDASWQNADSVVSAPAHDAGIYLSNDDTITWRDLLLRTTSHTGLPPLASHRLVTNLAMPSNALIGTRYLAIAVDHLGKIPETNENNNIQKQAVDVVAGPFDLPDLEVTAFTPTPTKVNRWSSILTETTVRNSGIGDSPTSYTGIFLSDDAVISTSDTLLARITTRPLGANQSALLRTYVQMSPTANLGTLYLGAYADYNALVAESNGSNNTRATSIEVQAVVDLRADLLTLDRSSQTAGGMVSVKYAVSNQGDLAAPESVLEIMLGGSTFNPRSLVLARLSLPTLAPSATHSSTVSVQIPYYRPASTNSYVWLAANATGQVSERTTGNNYISSPLSVAEYTGAQLQLEFVADGNTTARSVTRTSVTMSASNSDTVLMVLKSKPLAGHWVLTSWSQTPTFTYDAMTDFSLGLLNSPIFPKWFTQLRASNGLEYPWFHMPNVALSGTLRVYGRTFALKPDFSGISGTAGFVRFDLVP
ncbi:MAG: hypothetical protein KDC95_09950 [Planctomycetes bacterium]|nr:hypothetical protein [Planctomycetota bacterium]